MDSAGMQAGDAPRGAAQVRKRIADRTPLLLASDRGGDRRALERLVEGTEWLLVTADDWKGMFQVMATVVCPVVLYDAGLRHVNWREGIATLTHSNTSAIVLLSDVSDPYLWNEVIRCGGFDVLTRPFRREILFPLLDFAYMHWKAGWPNRPGGRERSG